MAESVRNTGVLGADGPPKCGKSEGKIRVAPMMDWTDGAKTTNCNSDLCRRKIAVAFW